MQIPWLSRPVPKDRCPARFSLRGSTHSTIERLEDRTVLATVFVVPIAQPVDETHTHSLTAALPLAGAGGTVIVQLGAANDNGPVSISLSDITIQGDANAFAGSLPSYVLNVDADRVTLTNLNLASVTLSATTDHTVVSRSVVGSFVETGAFSDAGRNTLSHNHITGSVDLQGNSGLFQLTGDLVEHNEFVSSVAIPLKLTNSTQTSVLNNRILCDGNGGIGIQVRNNSDLLNISGNTIEMTGAGATFGMVLVNTGGGTGNIIGAKVLNNILNTDDRGTGLYINIFGNGGGMNVVVEGNELNLNKVGIDINGVTNSATGAGSIDIGGGTTLLGTSNGGNNLHGFDGINGHYAINLHNTDANITVSAQFNLFDAGITLGTIVRDGGNGGGTGTINTANALDSNHAYVQSLYTQLLGRVGDNSIGGEVDQWVAKLAKVGQRGVAKGILYSDESLSRVVDELVDHYLDRDATDGEITKYAKQLKAGKNITRIEANILGSTEYQARIDTSYVQALYGDLLGRSATSDELTKGYHSIQGLGLVGVAAKIAGSKERRLDAVNDLYRDFLHRDATADEAIALSKKPGDLLRLRLQLLSSDDFFTHG